MAKILLVEDDNNLREIYEARLQAEGYDIVSAKDGEEALSMAKKEQPDLIISDVMMPRISGFEMLDILRNTEGLKDVRVIMLTALGQAEDKTRADALGADRYLVKSQVTLEDIVKAASDLLAGAPSATASAAPPTAQPAVTPTPAPVAAPVAPAAPVISPPPVVSPVVPILVAPVVPVPSPMPTVPALTVPATTAVIPPVPATPIVPSTTAPIPITAAPATLAAPSPAPVVLQPPAVQTAPTEAVTPLVAPAELIPAPAAEQPVPAATAPTPPASTENEATVAAQAQDTSTEQAAVQSQIDDFATNADGTGTPKNSDTLMADAVKNLVSGSETPETNESSLTPPETAEPTPTTVTGPVVTMPVTTPPEPLVTAPAPVSAPVPPTTHASNDDSVTISKKKIISPLTPGTVQSQPDLHDLLAKEGMNLDDNQPNGAPMPSTTGQPNMSTMPHQPGHVISPSPVNASGQPIDPNSISL
jgi:CheY-like chemotaxis protein